MQNLVANLVQGPASGTKATKMSPGMIQLRRRSLARDLCYHVFATLQNVSGSGAAVTQAEAVNVLSCIFSSYMLQSDQFENPIVHDNDDFLHMRALFGEMTGDDFKVLNQVTGQLVALNALPAGTAVTPVIAANAQVVLELEFYRAFEMPNFPERRYDWCPGRTQCRRFYSEITRGPNGGGAAPMFSPSAIWAQGADTQIRVTIDDEDSEQGDKIVPIVHGIRSTEVGLIRHGPDGGLLAVYDFAQPDAASPYTQISMQRVNDSALYEAQNQSDLRVAFARLNNLFPQDIFDITQVATRLFRLARSCRLENVPTGRFVFSQPNNDVPNPDMWWVYIPNFRYQAAVQGQKSVSPSKPVVSLTAPKETASLPPHIRAICGATLSWPKASVTFQTRPGLLAVQGKQPTPYIPPHLSIAAKRLQNDAARFSQVCQEIAAQIPGFLDTSRKNPNVGVDYVMACIRAMPTPI